MFSFKHQPCDSEAQQRHSFTVSEGILTYPVHFKLNATLSITCFVTGYSYHIQEQQKHPTRHCFSLKVKIIFSKQNCAGRGKEVSGGQRSTHQRHPLFSSTCSLGSEASLLQHIAQPLSLIIEENNLSMLYTDNSEKIDSEGFFLHTEKDAQKHIPKITSITAALFREHRCLFIQHLQSFKDSTYLLYTAMKFHIL